MLAFHVTYWDRLGWPDPFALSAATQRQQRYVKLGISPEVYTPALVVDGRLDAVGSDAGAVDRALLQAAATQQSAADIRVTRDPDGLAIVMSPGTGHGSVVLLGYDRLHRTLVARGENEGHTLEEANIVRSIAVLGDWTGQTLALHVPWPTGQDAAILLQQPDGRIVGAAVARRDAPSIRAP